MSEEQYPLPEPLISMICFKVACYTFEEVI